VTDLEACPFPQDTIREYTDKLAALQAELSAVKDRESQAAQDARQLQSVNDALRESLNQMRKSNADLRLQHALDLVSAADGTDKRKGDRVHDGWRSVNNHT
jgi:FtsZ-binding cell division protein ZapB